MEKGIRWSCASEGRFETAKDESSERNSGYCAELTQATVELQTLDVVAKADREGRLHSGSDSVSKFCIHLVCRSCNVQWQVS